MITKIIGSPLTMLFSLGFVEPGWGSRHDFCPSGVCGAVVLAFAVWKLTSFRPGALSGSLAPMERSAFVFHGSFSRS